MHDCGPFVFIATNTTLLFLQLSVAVSHIGCPERKIGSAASYPIADRAAVSILSVVGLSHRTLFITSRASFLSACHRHSHHLEPQIIWIKCYLFGRVQQRSQPLSERFLELVVLHTLRHSIAQSKKIMCPNYARSQLRPFLTNACRSVGERRSGPVVIETWLEPLCEEVHASLAVEFWKRCWSRRSR